MDKRRVSADEIEILVDNWRSRALKTLMLSRSTINTIIATGKKDFLLAGGRVAEYGITDDAVFEVGGEEIL